MFKKVLNRFNKIQDIRFIKFLSFVLFLSTFLISCKSVDIVMDEEISSWQYLNIDELFSERLSPITDRDFYLKFAKESNNIKVFFINRFTNRNVEEFNVEEILRHDGDFGSSYVFKVSENDRYNVIRFKIDLIESMILLEDKIDHSYIYQSFNVNDETIDFLNKNSKKIMPRYFADYMLKELVEIYDSNKFKSKEVDEIIGKMNSSKNIIIDGYHTRMSNILRKREWEIEDLESHKNYWKLENGDIVIECVVPINNRERLIYSYILFKDLNNLYEVDYLCIGRYDCINNSLEVLVNTK